MLSDKSKELKNIYLNVLQTLKEFFTKLKYTNWVTFGISVVAILLQVINNELLKVSYPNFFHKL